MVSCFQEMKLGRLDESIKNNNKLRSTVVRKLLEAFAKYSITRYAIAGRVCPIRSTVRYAFDGKFDCSIVKTNKNRNKRTADRGPRNSPSRIVTAILCFHCFHPSATVREKLHADSAGGKRKAESRKPKDTQCYESRFLSTLDTYLYRYLSLSNACCTTLARTRKQQTSIKNANLPSLVRSSSIRLYEDLDRKRTK